MLVDKKLIICPICKSERQVGISMFHLINSGKYSGKCRHCSALGNRKRLGSKASYETREKQKKAKIGIKLSQKTKDRMSNSKIGIKFTEEHIKNLKLSHIGVNCGEKNGNWIKDRTKLAKHQKRNDYTYKEWRKKCLVRDNYQCKICGEKYTKENKLIVHHILPWSQFPQERYNINNGITLCKIHHPRKREDEQRLISTLKKLIGSYEQ
jgi:5-methylcytosine-specific restriction endonuclease McrA